MKTNYRIAIALFFAVALLIFADALNNSSLSSASGAAAGHTGSPGDGNLTCATSGCHVPGPTPAVMAGWITSNIPGSGYVPGNTYTITATATRPNHVRFGFQVSPQSITGTLLGTLIITNTTETQLIGLGKYVTHKAAGTSGAGSKTWNFNWTAPVAGTGNVTFYGAFNIANNNGNSSGDTIYKSTLVVSECAVPAQPGTITGNTPVCPGSSQNYSVPADPGATSYTWTLPSGWTGTSTTNSINVSAGTTSGNITVTANNACGASTVRTLAVTVNNVTVFIVSTNVTCFGSADGSATASPSGGSNPYTFAWSNAASSSAITNLSAGTYTVTVTDAIGCTKTASVTITEPAQLTGCGTPSIAICLNDSTLLGCPSTGGTPPYSYLWTPSTGLDSPTSPTPIAAPSSTTPYTIVVTDNHGCTVSSTWTVVIYPLPPTPVISVSGDTLFSNLTGPYMYQWYNSAVLVASGPSDYYVTLTPGNYTVTVISTDGCASTSAPYPYFPTAIENIVPGAALSVYPNPAINELKIKNAELRMETITIYNSLGGKVFSKNIFPDNRPELTVDISFLDKGIYMLTGQTDKGNLVQRFAVVR